MHLDPTSQESIAGAAAYVRMELRALRTRLQRGQFHADATSDGLDVRLVVHEGGDLAIAKGLVDYDDTHGIACETATVSPNSDDEELDGTATELVEGVVDQLMEALDSNS